jgi:hypothetical protein
MCVMENNRGQSRSSEQSSSNSGSKQNTSHNLDRSIRRTRGTVDMDPQESIASSGVTQRGSGLTTKRNVTGSDYDGQNGGE